MKYLRPVGAILFGIFWGLLVAEVSGRILAAQGIIPNRVGYDLYVSHPIGWTLEPNVNVTAITVNGLQRISTNSTGFRDDEYSISRDPDGERILIIGDSFVLGMETAQEEMFHVLLEEELGGKTDVIAIGASGYQTTQEYLAYQHIGNSYDPDLVLLMLYVGNDVTGNRASATLPYYSLDDDGLTLHNYPYSGSFSLNYVVGLRSTPLMRMSQLAFLVGIVQQAPRDTEVASSLYNPHYCQIMKTENYPEPTEEDWEITKALLASFRQSVEADGARFGVVLIPVELQVEGLDDYSANCPHPVDGLIPPDIQGRLIELMESDEIAYLDLRQSLSDAYEETNNHIYNPNIDSHWSSAGHRIVADQLLRWLEDM